MKLSEVEFHIDWPVSIEVVNLRKYIVTNLIKKGQVIRWSIVDIQNNLDVCNKRTLCIRAVLVI